MSRITEIYDAIVSVLSTELTGYTRLPNPYSVDQNTFLYLQNGYGLAIGPGVDTERYVGCLITWRRDFTIIVVNQITTTMNNTDAKVIIEKGLLDAHDGLRKAIYLNSTLGGKAIKATLTDDQGVSFIDADALKFIAVEMTVSVEYQEDPNT